MLGSEKNSVPNPTHNVGSRAMEMDMDDVPSSRSNVMPTPSTGIDSVGEETNMDAVPYSRSNPVSEPTVNDFLNDKRVEHPLILSGDREMPFTYLASLSAKWAGMRETAYSVQGKVKVY